MNKFFKKADEMEMAINYKAMRNSWVFLVTTLVIWECVEVARGNTDSPVILLVLLQTAIFWSCKMYYTKKMSVDNDPDEK